MFNLSIFIKFQSVSVLETVHTEMDNFKKRKKLVLYWLQNNVSKKFKFFVLRG